MNGPVSKAVIKAMPYEERLRRYHAEKDEMFKKCRNLPASELQDRHKRLIEKWMV